MQNLDGQLEEVPKLFKYSEQVFICMKELELYIHCFLF